MKATIEFDLPDERDEFALMQKAGEYRATLYELDQWLRSQIKHANRIELQPARDELNRLSAQYGVEIT